MKLRRSGAAGRDLDAIYDYTRAQWDAEQADAYVRSLEEAFDRLREHPMIGASIDQLRRGYRRLGHERHVIYYRVHSDEIEIVRILHQSMDAPRHLL